MTQPINSTSWLAVMAASLTGFGLLLAPAEHTDRVRVFVRDIAYPGLWVVDAGCQFAATLPSRFEKSPHDKAVNGALLAERDAWEQRCRELQTVNAQLVEKLHQIQHGQVSPFLAEPGTPLFVPELIEAKVIGAEELQQAAQRVSFKRVLDVGAYKDIVTSDFVVSSSAEVSESVPPMIDQGADNGLHADQPVYAGRCVIGKVGQVGRWTSTVIPLTDPEFRGRAQIVRSTPQGLVLGAEGVIAGDGEGRCRLLHISATDPVATGDEVYTSNRLAGLPVPMYYGRVVDAALAEGASHWEIVVKPAESIDETRVVQVMRSVINSDRAAIDTAGDAEASQ